jgi:hypothetical protein
LFANVCVNISTEADLSEMAELQLGQRGLVWIETKTCPTNILVMTKLWSLFGWLPIIWHANGSLANVVHFSCQCWSNHRLSKGQPKFWLAKYLVGQLCG